MANVGKRTLVALAVLVLLAAWTGLARADGTPLPNVSGWDVGLEGPLPNCPDVTFKRLARPENADKPYYDASAWYVQPDLQTPFILILVDPDTGLATEFFVDYDRDGAADKHAFKFEDLGLPGEGDVCEIAKEVE